MWEDNVQPFHCFTYSFLLFISIFYFNYLHVYIIQRTATILLSYLFHRVHRSTYRASENVDGRGSKKRILFRLKYIQLRRLIV